MPTSRKTPSPATSAALQSGQEALERFAWEEARDRFREALVGGDSAEAWEGLGQAVFFLEDLPLLFEARERAYLLYREAGDPRSAARMAVMVAIDTFDYRGDAAVGNGWLQRARRLTDGLGMVPERGLVFAVEGHLALLNDNDLPRALQCAADARAVAAATHAPEIEVMSLAIEGLAKVTGGDVADGMRLLDESTTAALAGECRDLNVVGTACCYLINACERVRDFERASQWCVRVREVCRRWRFTAMFTTCRLQYATTLVYRGAWTEAETELEAAIRELESLRPLAAAAGHVRLGELRRRQGKLDEARERFTRAGSHRLACLGRAELALADGAPLEAIDEASAMLARLPSASRTERVAALDVIARAAAAAGDRARGEEVAREIAATATALDTDPVHAAACLAEGLVTTDATLARARLEEAVERYERAHIPYEAAQARLALARAHAAQGRGEAAAREASAARDRFHTLGAARGVADAEALLATIASPAGARTPVAASPLSAREIEVLRLVAEGLGDKEIAERLFLSPHTVHRHVANVLTKLDLPSRAAAAAHASKQGWLG